MNQNAPALDRPPMPPEKTATVYRQTIHYFEAGKGAPVILLHGLGSSAEAWLFNIDALAARFRVIALDQIGFGRSDKPLLDYRIRTFAEFLHGFIEELGLTRAALVGNSLGGWIACHFAAHWPQMVEKLVLVGTAGLSQTFPELNPASFAQTHELLKLVVHDQALATEALARDLFLRRLQFNDGYTIARTMDGIANTNQFLDPLLAKIQTPTLVLWGRQDRLFPLSDGERFCREIPRARLQVIENCGHVPQFERAEEFNRAVIEFLSSP